MDPVTVLGLTCNVLQLADLGYKGLALCWKLYKNGEDVKTSDMRELVERLSQGHKRFKELLPNVSSYSEHSDLLDVCARCESVSSRLTSELNSLALPAKSNVVLIFGKALKSVRKSDEIARLSSQLDNLRKVLDSRVLMSTYVLVRQSGADLNAVRGLLDQSSSDLLDAFKDGCVESAALMTKNALECREIIEKQNQATRDHIDKARADLSADIVNDGALTRTQVETSIESLATKVESMTLSSKQNDTFVSVMQILSYPEMNLRSDSIGNPHRGTCEWIFNQQSFTEWLVSDDLVVWIQGKAGSGKSTLMSFLVEESTAKDSRIQKRLLQWTGGRIASVLSFYFWESGTELQRSTEGLLRSLLHQVLTWVRQSHELTQSVLGTWDLISISEDPARLTAKRLKKLFIDLIKSLNIPTCLFLDGLDEFNDDEELLDLLDDLKGLQVKICTSSRPSPAFEAYFEDDVKISVHELTHAAIDKFVQERLHQDKRMRRLVSEDAESAQLLVQQIIRMAQGVFLWVDLVVRDLVRGLTQRDSLSMLERRVERLPTKIQDLYEVMWNRTKADHEIYEKEAALCFRMMLDANKPVEVSTSVRHRSLLVFGLAMDGTLRERCLKSIDDSAVDWLGFEMNQGDVMTRLKACTAGFVEFQDLGRTLSDPDLHATANLIIECVSCRVTFIHKSVAEFLNSSSSMRKLLSAHASDGQYERQVLESEVLSWGLMLMTQSADLPGDLWHLPDIPDDERSLPWFDVMESLLRRVSHQSNFDSLGFADFHVESQFGRLYMEDQCCRESMCPAKTSCFGRHVELDMIAWILSHNFVNVAYCLIQSQRWSKGYLTNLLWLYNPTVWAKAPLLEYLVDHGADLNATRLFHGRWYADKFAITDPTESVGKHIIDCIIEELARHDWTIPFLPAWAAPCLCAARLIFKRTNNMIYRHAPRFWTRAPGDYPLIMLDWSLYDFACAYLLRLDFKHKDCAALVAEFLTLLETTRTVPDRTKRALIVICGCRVWPILKENSTVFFERVLPLLDKRLIGYDPTYVRIRAPTEPSIAWFLEKVMSEERQFKTVRDAYIHCGWTDEELTRCHSPLSFYQDIDQECLSIDSASDRNIAEE